MYPNVPFEGISWPITQHSGIISEKVLRGLVDACIELNGRIINADVINDYLVSHSIVTSNYRSDSNKADAWRDYQQILSEFGLIYSTKICNRIILTPVAIAYADGEISYKELITLQTLRFQYPNGHKTQISPSLRNSYETSGNKFSYSSFAGMQAELGMLVRPAVLIWQILYSLHNKGEKATLSIDELQRFVVRCMKNSDAELCVNAIIRSRHSDYQLSPLDRARRNLQDWIKILCQTPLFYSDYGGNASICLSHYSIQEAESVSAICHHLSMPETFWIYTGSDSFKLDWFDFYGGIDLGTNWIPTPKESDEMSTLEGDDYDNMDVLDSQEVCAGFRNVELQTFTPIYVAEEGVSRKVVSIYDYKKSERGHRLHDNMVNLIASKCVAKGAEVSSDPKTVDLFIRYKTKEFILEVKSITPSNFISRLRVAIGQVHQYDYMMHRNTEVRGRLGLAFTANIPRNDWTIPFVTQHMDMDLLCMNANTLSIKTNNELSLELYG